MALYHFHVGQISRSKGYSAIAASAYRSGEKLYDDYYGETQDYTHKGGVVMSGLTFPSYVPEKYRDRQTLWNELEKAEKHPKAQLAYSFDIALQNEFTRDENIALVKEFIAENFASKGMICDWAVHEPEKKGGIPNPHFHVLVPIRPMMENGEWGEKQHREYQLDSDGNRIRDKNGKYVFNAVPTTDWGRPETLETWRRNWAKLVNEKFREKGMDLRIDERSYRDQGKADIPQVHEGSSVRRMEAKGIETDKGSWNRWARKANRKLHELIDAIKDIREWIACAREALALIQATEKEVSAAKQASEIKAPVRKMKAETPVLNKAANDAPIQKKGPEKIPSVGMQVMEYYNHRNRVANSYEYGSQKAKHGNLQNHAREQGYIEEKKLVTLDDVDRQAAAVEAALRNIDASLKPMNEKHALLKKYDGYFRDYLKYLPVYEESKRIFFKSRKEAYKEEHGRELKLFHRAKRELEKAGVTEGFSEEKALNRKRMAKLEKQIGDKLSSSGRAGLEEEVKFLGIIRKAMEYYARRDPNETDGLILKKPRRIEDAAQKKTLQPQTVKGKSFSDRLAELEAKADRINAGRKHEKSNPIRDRYER